MKSALRAALAGAFIFAAATLNACAPAAQSTEGPALWRISDSDSEIFLFGTVHILPPTMNLDTPDPECDLDYVPDVGRKASVDCAICNCVGFGSKNSALVLRRL